MIIRNATIINKKRKRVMNLISRIVNVIILAMLFILFIRIFSAEQPYQSAWYILLIALGSLFSASDLVLVLKRKPSIVFYAFQFIEHSFFHSNDKFELTDFQKKFCELIYGLEQKNRFIYVFGKVDKGKTTAVLYLLKDMISNSSTWEEMPWPDNLVFIDCTSEKEEILDLFSISKPKNTRIKEFSGKIVVIDNIECLGSEFLKDNIGLFSSQKSLFIIIEDITGKNTLHEDVDLTKALLISDFNKNIISVQHDLDLFSYLIRLSPADREVFFSLYFLTRSSIFAKKEDLRKALKLSGRRLNKSLKTLEAFNLFVPFPFNNNYFYCRTKKEIETIESMFVNDLTYNETLKKIILTKSIHGESRWLCLIKCNDRVVNGFNEEMRLDLFHLAINNCNFNSLHDELERIIAITPSKAGTFLYERARLSFNIGNHKNAVEYYESLISTQKLEKRKAELQLRIIEANHGNPQDGNMKLINSWIKELFAIGGIYSLYAKYWDLHIMTEKGVFPVEEFGILRMKLARSHDMDNDRMNTFIQRCYSDEIRCLHILGTPLSNTLCEEYGDFLRSVDVKGSIRYTYFYNLHVKANTIQYINIPLSLIGDNSSYELEDLKLSAEIFYEKAFSSPYKGEKSLRVARIKKLELNMIAMNFDFDEALAQIKSFYIHSQMNNVSVHEAFCCTLLMKLFMIAPSNLNNDIGLITYFEKEIEENYTRGRSIYDEYDNKYGIFRLDFIYCLYNLLTSTTNEKTEDSLNALLALFSKKENYPKEEEVKNAIINRWEQNNLPKQYVLDVLKVYPIILQ